VSPGTGHHYGQHKNSSIVEFCGTVINELIFSKMLEGTIDTHS
jgi:hypothetical protein